MEDSAIKLSSDKELTVNLSSIEDLLNAINYATKQLSTAKEGLENKEITQDFDVIKRKLDDIYNKQMHMRDVVFEDFAKETQKALLPLGNIAREDTLKTLVFELNRFNKVDNFFKKFSIRNIVITSIVSSILTIVTIGYTQISNPVIQNYFKARYAESYFMFSREGYELKEGLGGSYVLNKKSKN